MLALLALPAQTSRVLARAEGSGLPVRDEQVGRAVRTLSRSVDRLSATVIVAGSLVAGSVLVAARDTAAGAGLFILSGLALVRVLIGGARR